MVFVEPQLAVEENLPKDPETEVKVVCKRGLLDMVEIKHSKHLQESEEKIVKL